DSGATQTLEYELEVLGGPRWFEGQVAPMPGPVGERRMVIWISHDITERKRAEEALRESEQRFRDLFESSPDAIFVEDLDGNVLDVNPASCRLHGLTREQLIGQNVRALVPPEQHQNAMEVFAQMVAGKLDRIEGESWTVENKEVPVEISVSRITHTGQPALLLQVRDITERKEAEQELARINAKLEQRNRELQDFAYAASHDLQEPLRKIRAFADLMQEDYGDKVDETGHYYLDRMQDAAARMSGLITDLLVYSRVTTKVSPFGRVDLNAVVADVLSDLEMQIEETNGRITVSNLPAIEADATQMHQLLQNFIGNALKFHRPGVAPVVEFIGHLEQQPVRDGDAPQTVCRLEVRDNGIGFDEKYLDRIFTPFQRLHGRSTYAGTGMGLAICRRIVERHHGALTARSAPGEGATFIVTLPVSQRPARMQEREGERGKGERGKGSGFKD
ncbi:MAG: PAS domain S-box protein, partial [Rhodothermales bacterium]